MKSDPKVIILCESTPANRFVYDLSTTYPEDSGLRSTLRKEFGKVGSIESNEDLLEFMRERGIWIVDCAFCPLHKFGNNYKVRRDAATKCLQKHTISYLQKYRNAELVTMFPSNCGYKKTELGSNSEWKIEEEFGFSKPEGLSDFIEEKTSIF